MNNKKAKLKAFKFGLLAELFVIIYLFLTFHRVLAWRMKTTLGEIDIIACRGNMLVFVEVKARKTDVSEVLSANQQRRIGDAAKLFLQKNSRFEGHNCRFDLIIFKPPLSIKHIKNSWVI